jgi:hypothetical protein
LIELIEAEGEATGGVALYVAVTLEDLGRREKALEYLERALDGGVAHHKIEDYPGFNNLRSDTRYREMMERDR